MKTDITPKAFPDDLAPPKDTPVPPLSDAVQEALAVTLRGCEELIPQADWVKKLQRSEQTGQALRIK